MAMFQKLKQKLAEEWMDSETSDREEGPGGGGGPRLPAAGGAGGGYGQEALEQEILELKEHINKNYFVYVKRIEKRKERIKELEEYAKLVIKDNEALTDKVAKLEECQQQLSDCRENLDQLEGFQSQELSKVKHMLLSAETALEKETKEKKRLEGELQRMTKAGGEADERGSKQRQAEQEVWKKRLSDAEAAHREALDEMKEMYEAKLARLENRLDQQDLTGEERTEVISQERDDLENEVRSLKSETRELKQRLSDRANSLERQLEEAKQSLSQSQDATSSLSSERDAARASLLELEIVHHEQEENLKSEREKFRLDVAKLTTEKETLEVTLERRDKELKSRKEEFRKEVSVLERDRDDARKQTETKAVRIGALEAELVLVKQKLGQAASRADQLQQENASLAKGLAAAEQELKVKEAALVSLHDDLETSLGRVDVLEADTSSLQATLDGLRADEARTAARLQEMQEERDGLARSKEEAEARCGRLEAEVDRQRDDLEKERASFPDRVEKSATVQDLRRDKQLMEDELAEKKKMIALHQKRMNDMKKTLQQEMKSSSSMSALSSAGAGSGSGSGTANGFLSPSSSGTAGVARGSPSPPTTLADLITGQSASAQQKHQPLASQFSIDLSSSPVGSGGGEISEVNFKYLKHVIFKFFTSRDYEAKHLTRAIATLLQFSADEEKLFQEHLDWKMSWFGSKPKLGSGQFSLSIEPS